MDTQLISVGVIMSLDLYRHSIASGISTWNMHVGLKRLDWDVSIRLYSRSADVKTPWEETLASFVAERGPRP